ncbi:MAG: hypothetical protein JNK94_07000 [Hyphomonadaceae bacterium]|nr:hypothetical protein [Hyphomonadaceae bacterium]
MTQNDWLSDVIVVNESSDPQIAGDVQVYRNATDVSYQLEHWYVGDVEHLALDGLGRRVVLGLDGNKVVVERTEPCPDGQALLLSWLLVLAQHLRKVRLDRATKKHFDLGAAEASGVLPTTVEGLIAYVGFLRGRAD